MKRYYIHIILIVFLIAPSIQAQVVDTTKNINTWNLVHNYSRFEDVALDTTMFDFHIDYNPASRNDFWAVSNLGNLGSASQALNVLDLPSNSSFYYAKVYAPYMSNPENTIFFNTRTPFTEASYTTLIASGSNEETVRITHTQNTDPFTNFGLDFETLNAEGTFDNSTTKVTKFTLFASSAKDKYAAFGSLHFNRFNNYQNGGIQSYEDFLNQDQGLLGYPVNLSNAKSSFSNTQLFYTQKFSITEKISQTDSSGYTTHSGKNFSFNHQFRLENNQRYYLDPVPYDTANTIYRQVYYPSLLAADSIQQTTLNNTFQFILGDPYTDKLSMRIYGGHEISRNSQVAPYNDNDFNRATYFDVKMKVDTAVVDTIVPAHYVKYLNDIFVGFYIAGPPENLWYWNIDSKYYLLGYHAFDFILNATFSRSLGDNHRLGINGKIESTTPDYFMMNNWSSTSIWKLEDAIPSQISSGGLFFRSHDNRLDVNLRAALLTNYYYLDANALPQLASEPIVMMNLELFKHFTIGAFNSQNNLLLQYHSAEELIRVPIIAARTSNYIEKSFFKDALQAQFGFDFYMTSSFQSSAFNPALNSFYLKEGTAELGAYPWLDLYLSLRIKRARIFASYNNALADIVSANYFTIDHYPMKPAHVRFGVAWTFYD